MNGETFCRKTWAQQGEDVILERLLFRRLKLPRDHEGCYVDVGAFHPFKGSNTKLLYDAGWYGLNVDVQQKSIELFNQARPRDLSVRSAVGAVDGEITAYLNAGGLSVASTCDPLVAEKMRQKGVGIVEERVRLAKLDSLLGEHLPGVQIIDFLNIDVEGLELDVLTGFSVSRYRPRVIAIEIHARDLTQALASPVADWLGKSGYVCVAATVITYFFIEA